MPIPNPIRLFHITALHNLQAIIQSGALLSKNSGAQAGINYQNIAHAGAQGARSVRTVPNPPGGNIHDFVPFYFAPRSPMLLAIQGGKVAGCALKQEDIVHLETTVDKANALGLPFVFYDRNATLAFSTPYTDLSKLPTAIAWDLLTETPTFDGYCKYWNNKPEISRYADRMERRQAEFLLKHRVPLSAIMRIGVIDEQRAILVRNLLASSAVNIPVVVMREWYFLPGQ
jgi:ssDNA thymidine ADP-ribosyltransferase, DarT